MSDLVTHSAVRLYPGRRTQDPWRVLNLANCQEYRCGKLAAIVLLSFFDGGISTEIGERLHARYRIERERIDEALISLVDMGLIVSPDDAEHRRYRKLFLKFARYGWVDSADYHVATLNYPFADYSKDGREIDYSRMVNYVEGGQDTNRTKVFSSASKRYKAPTTSNCLNSLCDPFSSVWLDSPFLEVCTRDKILSLLSTTFGQLRTRRLADDQSLMADAIGKTSPSGGSRHPTEAYIFVRSIAGLEQGIYHFNVKNSSLDMIATLDLTPERMQRLFSGPLRASFEVDAVIVMSSVFERSMYRYREPRSFRAIYMDVGHLSGTLDLTCKALKLNCLVQHGLDDRAVAEAIGLDILVEGIIYGAAVGGARASRTSQVDLGVGNYE